MTELQLRQLFKNLSDCYADTGRFENDGSYTEGEVIQAMTEDRFIEAMKKCERKALKHVFFKKAELSWIRRRDGYKHDDEECGLAIDHYIETGEEP